jgi:hypothetical protein
MGLLWWSGAAGAAVDPCVVVDALCAHIAATKQSCGRFIDRLLPMQRVVRCDMEEVLAAARALLGADIDPSPPPALGGEAAPPATAVVSAAAAAPPRTWSAEVRVRNTDAVSRSLITAGLGDLMRRRFRVDLEAGSHTLVVEACMSIAGVSVVRGGAYWRNARYNVRLLAETDAEREARLHASQVAADAAAAKKASAAAASAAATA